MPSEKQDKSPEETPEKESSLLFYSISGVLVLITITFVILIIKDFPSHPKVEGEVKFKKTKKQENRELIGMIGKTSPKNLKKILEKAKSEDSQQRMYALRALQYYGVSQAHHLVKFLDDSESKVRTAAMQILGNMRYLPAASPIVKNLKSEEKVSSKIIGIQALSKILRRRGKLPQARPALKYLVDVVDSENPALRKQAMNALEALTGEQTAPDKPTPESIRAYWEKMLHSRYGIERD